jgi:hypothetical protein
MDKMKFVKPLEVEVMVPVAGHYRVGELSLLWNQIVCIQEYIQGADHDGDEISQRSVIVTSYGSNYVAYIAYHKMLDKWKEYLEWNENLRYLIGQQ